MALTRIISEIIQDNTIDNSDISASFGSSISGSLGANASTIRTLSATTVSGSRDAASISGSLGANANTIRTLSETTVSGSLGANASTIRTLSATTVSGSRDAASISGSLGANASTIRTLSSTTVSGSFGNQRVGTTDDVKFTNITGSGNVSASGDLSATGNLDIDGTSNFTGNVTMQNDLSVTGRINAEEIHTTFISASITTTTGSNIFGDATTDSHQFTGSLDVSGSLRVSDGNLTVSDTLTATNIGAFTAAGAIDFSNENMTNVDIDSGNIDSVTFGSTVQSMISGSRDAASISGSFGNQRVGTTDDVEFANITGSNVSASGLDVDGTTNLDNTDIDGTLTVDGGNIVFNEASANQDFRVESNGQTHMLFVDGDDKIGIAEDTPTALLHITRAAGSYTAANLAESAGAGVFRVQPDGTNQTSLHASSVTNYRVALQVSGSSSGDNDIVLQPFAGRVGIGTRAPASPLDVSSAETSNTANFNSTSGTANMTFKENGTLTGQIEFHSGSNQISQIVTRKTGGTLALGSNNVQTLFITDNDNVGIGTNNPAVTTQIHSDDETLLYITTDAANRDVAIYFGLDYDGTANYAGIQFDQSDDALKLFNANSLANHLVISSSGNIGLGTSNPAEELHVDKDQNTLTRIKLENQTAGSSAQVQSNYVTNAGEFNVGLTSAQHSLAGAAIILNTANTDMFIGCNNAERIRIKASGPIGFGSSTPGTVNGTDRTGGGDTGILHLQGTVPRILFDDNGDTPQFALTAQDFFTIDKIPDDSSGEGQLLKVESTGKLTVSCNEADDFAAFLNNSNSAGFGLRVAGGTNSGDNIIQLEDDGGTTNFAVNADGGASLVGSLSQNTSDKRLKENIEPITNALEKVNKIQGSEFDWLEKTPIGDLKMPHAGKHDVGLIAQQVKEILPEAVSLAPIDWDNAEGTQSKTGENYLTVDYTKIVPLLVESIKELSQKVELQQKRIKELEK